MSFRQVGLFAVFKPLLRFVVAGSFLVAGSTAVAQAPSPGGWTFTLDGGFAVQGDADLDGDSGSYSLHRTFYSAGLDYRWNYRNSVGLSVGAGTTDYDFEGSDGGAVAGPWDEVDEWRVSLPTRLALGETSTLFMIPTLRDSGESGSSDGQSWGLLAGAAWRFDADLTIGPGIGVISRLEESARVFPILLIDWNITERWNLSTGRGLAASQGPGLTLSYRLTPAWQIGLAGRYEEIQFRLDNAGAAPGGVGEDRAIPLVVTAGWSPNRQVRLGMFAGLEFGGELNLYDARGREVESRDYDTAPVYGATFAFDF